LWFLARCMLRPSRGAKLSLLGLLLEPAELVATIRLKFLGALPARDVPAPEGADAQTQEDVKFCSDMLTKVSRSFAAVIRQLPDELCLPICVFYLVLRALDTVEDETALEKFDVLVKKQGGECNKETRLKAQQDTLRAFYAAVYMDKPEASPVPPPDMEAIVAGKVGYGDEAILLENYDKVVRVLKTLPAAQQAIISDICMKMGDGMANYLARDLAAGTADEHDYNSYCHIVAGYVGEGLTRQFYASGLEGFNKPGTKGMEVMEMGLGTLASDMGLFLQKVNIIRDYLEDQVDGRSFWPRTIWGKYAKALSEFREPQNIPVAVECMNELIANALELAPRSIAYLNSLQNSKVLMFCAAPQVMALLTMNCLFDNAAVFRGVVKVRKTLAARVFLRCNTMEDVNYWYTTTAAELRQKLARSECKNEEIKSRIVKALDTLDAALQNGM